MYDPNHNFYPFLRNSVKRFGGFRSIFFVDQIKAMNSERRSINNPEDPPPTIIFLGGGMGAGKSTVVKKLMTSSFMKKHGHQVVTIAADDVKMKDPVFRDLENKKISNAAVAVHPYSVDTAESMLLRAVRERRDIVFDGTMMWLPFIQQTIEMIRDNKRVYTRGPGYKVQADGTVVEKYWVPVEGKDCEGCSCSVPYRIVMAAVTVKPGAAVARGKHVSTLFL